MTELETVKEEVKALAARVAALEAEKEPAMDPLMEGTLLFREQMKVKPRATGRQ